MFLIGKLSFVSHALRGSWYWALAAILTCAVWAGTALAMWPTTDRDGSYASRPYGVTTNLENQAVDLLFQLRDVLHPERRTRGMAEPITIIEIDEASIKASGVRIQTWPRSYYARLIDRASEGGASVIGLDMLLSEAGGLTDEAKAYDQQLSDSIANAGNVVLALKSAAGGLAEALEPLPIFAEAAYAIGFVDFPVDSDGFVRSTQISLRLRADKDTQLSFATRLAEGYLASRTAESAVPPSLMRTRTGDVVLGDRVLALRTDQFLQIDYRARSPAFRRVSAAELLFNERAQVADELFRDRIVLIGVSAIAAGDLFYTPFYEPMTVTRLVGKDLPVGPAMTPGVEQHAASVATILFGQTPVRPPFAWRIIAVLVPLVLVALAVFRLRALWGLVVVVVVAVAVLAAASWIFNSYGLILPLASAWIGMGVLGPVSLGLRYAHERALRDEKEIERAQIMEIFSRCVSQEVADELWERRSETILIGERRIVTVVFTDIRGFTSLSETAASDRVVRWLNDYFSRMHAVVNSHCGHISKFMGDGLMIVFGAPVGRDNDEEARAAVACALDMLEAVEQMNKDWKEMGRPQFKIGVGIHTGEATCGVVGAKQRLEYTVIGDTVNLASRLESTTKEKGVSLLISEDTAQLLGDKYELRGLGEVTVKGKMASTPIFTIDQKKVEQPPSTVAVAEAV